MVNFGALIKEIMLMLALAAGSDTNADTASKAEPEREPVVQDRRAPHTVPGQATRAVSEPEPTIAPAKTQSSTQTTIQSATPISSFRSLSVSEPSTEPSATAEATPESGAAEVSPTASQFDLALGHNHTCGLKDGDVSCWGSSYYNQTDVPDDVGEVLDIAAADQNTCALESDTLTCWGIDGDYDFPVEDGVQVSTGGFHVCFIDAMGLWCDRGGNEYGELNIPADLASPTQVAAGTTHTCAIGDDGVQCWGSNEFGEIDVPELTDPRQIAAGGWYSCAIDGPEVKCWGNNDFGQLEVPTLVEPTAIMAGHNHACAIDRYGLQCWGRNAFGQADVPSLVDPAVAQPGTHHSCAVEADGETVCWGYNAQGQASPAG